MGNVPGAGEGSILLIGDSRPLLDAITAGLAPLPLEVCVLGEGDGKAAPVRPDSAGPAYRLIVFGLSHNDGEPLSLLAQAGLGTALGSTPLLIIAPQPFCADLAHNTLRLPLPLRAGVLPPVVEYLLLHAPQTKQ